MFYLLVTINTFKTVCGPPPEIENGVAISDTTNIVSGTTILYKCKDGYFAYGVNSNRLQTQCIEIYETLVYNVPSERLATCAPTCKF